MALNLSKAYTPTSGQIANSSSYNTDIANLFNAFSGLEGQTSTLGGLTITPSANGTTKLLVNNAAGAELLSLDTTNSYMKLKATGRFYLDGGGDTYIVESSANILDLVVGGATSGRFSTTDLGLVGSLTLGPTKKLYLDNGGDTYITESAANILDLTAGGVIGFEVRAAYSYAPVGVIFGVENNNNKIDDASTGAGTATLYIGNAAITVSSDKRLKENIEDTKLNALEKVNKLRVVDFNWNDPSDKCLNNRNARGKWTAMIAQEVVDVLPFVVNAPRPDGGAIDYDSPDVWQIEYANIVPILTKAIQELTLRLEALEKV